MKFIGKHWKLIIFLIFLSITLSAIGYSAMSVNLEVDLTTVGKAPVKTIVVPYAFSAPEPRTIEWFPIDEDVIYQDSDFFWGSSGWVQSSHGRHGSRTPETPADKYEGLLTFRISNNWHPTHASEKDKVLVTFHGVWGYYNGVNLPERDIQRHEDGYYDKSMTGDGFISNDNREIIYVDSGSGSLEYKNWMQQYANQYWCYKDVKLEDGSPEDPKQTVYTNWVYSGPARTRLDCEGLGGKGKGQVSTGGTAFVIACFQVTDAQRHEYGNGSRGNIVTEGIYDILESWLGNLKAGNFNEYYDLAVSFDTYHAASKNPNVDVYPSSDVGSKYTSTNETQIQVGPFTMSDYVTASDYSVHDFDYALGTWEREENAFGSEYETFYGERAANLQSVFGSGHLGSLLSMTAVLKNEAGNTKKVVVFDRNSSTSAPMVPSPGSTFNITLSSSAASGYDELYEIECLYQRIHACANMDQYTGTQYAVTLKESTQMPSKISQEFYDCKGCEHTDLSLEERADNADAGFPKHEYWCGGSNWCDDGYANGQHPSENVAEHTFCTHAQNGHPERPSTC